MNAKLFPGYEPVPPLSERDLQQAVIDTARTFGFVVAHFRPAQTKHGWKTPVAADGKGFPDLLIGQESTGRMIAAELKANGGKLTPEQEMWAAVFRAIAAVNPLVEYHVWTPAEWNDGSIVEILSGRPATVRSAA